MDVTIEMLGVGACCLSLGDRRILIDAYNEFYTMKDTHPNDILLFTHDDRDHFLAEKVLEHASVNLVIGPPSIAYPLLASGKMDPAQLKIIYPPEKANPQDYMVDDIKISVIQTEHFIGWNTIHVSYLITVREKKIFVTGDSYIDPTRPQLYENLDCLIYSLIKEEVVKGKMNSEAGVIYHLQEIQEIKYRYNPQLIVCNHVLNCGWSVDGDLMAECLERNHIRDVFVPVKGNTSIVT